MPSKALKTRITTPTGIVPYGRGFYQLEEEELYLPIEYPGERPHFFSYLESDTVSLHLDRDGRLIFVELTLPRRRWRVKENLVGPEQAAPADIRFLDFRENYEKPTILCDRRREKLMIRFSKGPSTGNYYLAENLIGQFDRQDQLVAIWVSDITDDLAGREIAAWRKLMRNRSLDKALIPSR